MDAVPVPIEQNLHFDVCGDSIYFSDRPLLCQTALAPVSATFYRTFEFVCSLHECHADPAAPCGGELGSVFGNAMASSRSVWVHLSRTTGTPAFSSFSRDYLVAHGLNDISSRANNRMPSSSHRRAKLAFSDSRP